MVALTSLYARQLLGCRVLRLGSEPVDGESAIKSKRCVEVAGFNLHANVRVAANDREGIEHLGNVGRARIIHT
jgi:hypothetical protein